MSESRAVDIQSKLVELLYRDAASAVTALNEEGADDVYGVAIVANAGFFSGVGLVSNTEAHLLAVRQRVEDPTLSPEYFELSVAEWDRYEWDSFTRTNEYLAQLEELYYEDELPVEDDGEFAGRMVNAVVEVLRRLDVRRTLASRHAPNLYVGLGFSDPTERERAYVSTAGEALNDQPWIGKLRALYGVL